ncbi:MAG: TetR/AcrR family transcriptional regulator [Pseudomonadota bacterium]
MARSDAEIATAVLAARDVFWRAGYDEASIEDIVAATGFNRYALYSEFGGKREVFLAALEQYHEELKALFLSHLANLERPPMQAFRAVFEFAIDQIHARGRGCLMCNVAGDISHREPIVRDRIEAYLEEITGSFVDALARADARGELNENLDPEDAAMILVTLIMGLGTAAEHGTPLKQLKQTLDATLAAISAPGKAY